MTIGCWRYRRHYLRRRYRTTDDRDSLMKKGEARQHLRECTVCIDALTVSWLGVTTEFDRTFILEKKIAKKAIATFLAKPRYKKCQFETKVTETYATLHITGPDDSLRVQYGMAFNQHLTEIGVKFTRF